MVADLEDRERTEVQEASASRTGKVQNTHPCLEPSSVGTCGPVQTHSFLYPTKLTVVCYSSMYGTNTQDGRTSVMS